MQLVHQINQAFNANIKVQGIFQYPTIKSIITLLEDGNEKQIVSGLVKISSKKNTVPTQKIFCAPGAGGNIVSFYELARLLEESHTVYGFQAYGLDANSKILETISLIASQNILDMQAEDPIGPYHLAGYSLGANVVYEMAMQLQQKGFEVATLYIFDGPPFHPSDKLENTTISYTETLLGILEMFFESSGRKNSSILAIEDLEHLSDSEQLKRVYKLLLEYNVWMNEDDFIRFVSVYIHQSNLPTQYTPEYQDKLDCSIYLFRPKDNEDSIDVLDDYGWQSLCNKEVTIHFTEGTHITMLNQPYVKDITDTILKIKKLQINNL